MEKSLVIFLGEYIVFKSNYEEKIMKNVWQLLAIFPLFLLIGCGHSINITPPMNTLDKEGILKINKNVGYYISSENLAKEVTTPGGGGDKVKYFPYKESEPALKKILSNIFDQVINVPAITDSKFIASNNISYIFTPEFETTSSSESLLTWPPTKFSITIDCKAVDKNGTIIWQTKVVGDGNAEFDEFKHDLSLAAKRATQKAFIKLQDIIITSGKF